jgi:hypothetical protein
VEKADNYRGWGGEEDVCSAVKSQYNVIMLFWRYEFLPKN